MVKILFINPNSSVEMTADIEREAKCYESNDLEVDVVKCDDSPSAIEEPIDDLIGGLNAVKLLQEKATEYDAAVIGCYGDPGLDAARSKVDIPVVGLFESCTYFGKLHGIRYSIITPGNWLDINGWEAMFRRYGEVDNIASVKCMNASVETTSSVSDEVIAGFVNEAVQVDGASTAVLACSAFAGRASKISEMTGFNVIDGIKESIFLAKMLVEYNEY